MADKGQTDKMTMFFLLTFFRLFKMTEMTETTMTTIWDYDEFTLKERIEKNTINLYNYLKHDGGSGTTVTGKALVNNKCPNLSIIDIDINKELKQEEKDMIRKNLIAKISDKDVIVQTASGGLHIYCNTDEYYIDSNRMVKCFTSNDYDVDIFSSIDSNSRSLVVLPGSKVRKNAKSPILTYKFVQGGYDSIITRSLASVLNDLDINIKVKQNAEIEKIMFDHDGDTVSDEYAVKLIEGLTGIEIHNDAGGRRIEDEVTLFTLFQSLNALPSDLIDDAYSHVQQYCKLTDAAANNFDKARSRYQNLCTSPHVLAKILRYWNNDYYTSVISPIEKSNAIVMNDIDLNDLFTINDIRQKAEQHRYNSNKELIEDLSRVLRSIDDGNDSYVIKSYNTFSQSYCLKYVSDAYIVKTLKRIQINEQTNAHTLLLKHLSKFTKQGVKFNSNDENILSLFHGYKHKVLDQFDLSKIKLFLDLILEVICDNEKQVYEYVINWISFIVQHPGNKTEVALVLKGLQGIGKNRFTDVLSEMLSGYSAKNITDISELTGQFNSIVEGKILIVLNELKNCGDDRLANFNSLKSIITDDSIRINEKLVPRRDAENVANFIFVSNNSFPVKIENGDRRYVVLSCNGVHKGDYNYFEQLCASFDEEFYSNLLTFFIKRDLTKFQIRNIPMTDAKQDLIDASKSPLDIWICEHYNELVEGIVCEDALRTKPEEMKKRTFQLQLKDKCERKRKRINNQLNWYYTLKPECKLIYNQTPDERIVEFEEMI